MDIRHQYIKNIFNNVFQKAGLQKFTPDPLLSNDETVYFTCATITPLKDIVKNDKINQGFYLHQPCLRLQTLNNPFKKSNTYQFPSYFNMLGTLIPKEKLISFQKNIIEVFDNLGIDRSDMHIFSPKTNIPIFTELQKKYITEFNTKPETYYHWKYGTKENISGIGLTFSIKQSNNLYRDIGQYVAILKDEKIIGAEFGFGIETFLAASKKMDNPYLAYSIASAINKNNIKQNFISTDVLSTVGALYSTGLTISNIPSNNYKRILNRAINNLCFFSDNYNITQEKIKNTIKEFMITEFNTLKGFDNFCIDYTEKLKSYYDEIKKKNDYVKNQISLGQSQQYIDMRLQQLYPILCHYEKIRE